MFDLTIGRPRWETLCRSTQGSDVTFLLRFVPDYIQSHLIHRPVLVPYAFDAAVVRSYFQERKGFAPIWCESLKEEYEE